MKTPKWQYLIAFAVLISITGIVHFSIRLWPGYAYQDYTSQENMLELQPSTTDSALSRFFKQLATTVRNSPIAVVPVETVPNNTIPEYVKATDVQEQINHTTSNVSYAQTTPPTPIEDSTPLSPRSLLSQPTFKPTSLPPCKEKYCMDYLTVSDRNAIKQCEFQTLLRNFNAKIKESKCRFMNGKGRLPVALASTEGCGNTWVRGLLEKVTGICTGFIYCDSIMRAEGFIGDNVKSGSVLVIKTHTIGPQWHGLKYTNPIDAYYGSAVYILRNPHDAAIAEWNRRATNSILAKNRLPHNESHTNVVPKELFAGEKWDNFLHWYMDVWGKRLTKWVINETSHQVHIVRYEDLSTDTFGELKKILQFLKIPHDDKEVQMRLLEDVEHFHREHVNDDYEHFTPEQKEFARATLLNVIKQAEANHKSDILKLDEYLDYFK